MKILRRDVVVLAGDGAAQTREVGLGLIGAGVAARIHLGVHARLVDRLADIGVDEKEVNIRNKLARGKFSAVFLIQCVEAIGISSLRLD